MMSTAIELPLDSDGVFVADRMMFGWWNTSLSPVGKSRSDQKHKDISATIVRSLLDDLKLDFLALGEITNIDLADFKEACLRDNLSIFDGTLKSGHLQFDTGIIYDNSRLEIIDYESIVDSHGSRNFKVANRIDFECLEDGSTLTVFVSHWPSRVVNEEIPRIRKCIATRLKEKTEKIRCTDLKSAIIILGDFNDEPFDESICWNLLATRDRYIAKTKTGYLYNPFWRHLGESSFYSHRGTHTGTAGSCFYNSGFESRWRTFDQILFSPSFLGSGTWHLNEAQTIILRTDYLAELVQSSKTHFDHLPILSSIERIHPSTAS